MPSVINAMSEIRHFTAKGNVYFSDESVFASALAKVLNTPSPASSPEMLPGLNIPEIRRITDSSLPGYLAPSGVAALLDAAGIPRLREEYASQTAEAGLKASGLGFPVVMKVTGPVHKSDIGGVVLNIRDRQSAEKEFDRLIKLPGAEGVLIQKMISGTEMFTGVKASGSFGHLVLTGPGGILIEIMKDIAAGLAPVGMDEALQMIRSLKSYRIIRGARGMKPVDEKKLAEIILRTSALAAAAPEISEMDINPLICDGSDIVAVDARILIEKKRKDN
jgi:acetyltransferase